MQNVAVFESLRHINLSSLHLIIHEGIVFTIANNDMVQLHSNTLGFRRCINVGFGVISNFIADGVLRLELPQAPRFTRCSTL